MKLDTNVSPEHFPRLIQLRGLPTIGRLQFSILLQLYDVDLPDARQVFRQLTPPPMTKNQAVGYRASIKSLCKRDYMVSNRAEGWYQITLRGVRMVREILQRCLPKDDRYQQKLCCRCKKNPRVQRPTFLHSWCKECIQKSQRRSEELGLRRLRPDLPCARCKTGTRCASKSGIVYQHCLACRKTVNKEKKTRWQERTRQRIEAGERVVCKCGNPVYVTPRYVSKRCKDCEWAHTAKGRAERKRNQAKG